MNFKDLVNSAIRTPEQIKKEEINLLNQAKEKAVNYILDIIKEDILKKANTGRIAETKSLTTIIIPYRSNLLKSEFDVKETEDCTRQKDSTFWNYYYRESTITMTVNDINRLEAFFDLLKQRAYTDGINISEPFILLEIREGGEPGSPIRIARKEKIHIKNHSLTASVKSITSTKGNSFGSLQLAIDYSYNG